MSILSLCEIFFWLIRFLLRSKIVRSESSKIEKRKRPRLSKTTWKRNYSLKEKRHPTTLKRRRTRNTFLNLSQQTHVHVENNCKMAIEKSGTYQNC